MEWALLLEKSNYGLSCYSVVASCEYIWPALKMKMGIYTLSYKKLLGNNFMITIYNFGSVLYFASTSARRDANNGSSLRIFCATLRSEIQINANIIFH